VDEAPSAEPAGDGPGEGPGEGPGQDDPGQVAELQRERDDLRRRVAALEDRRTRRARLRRGAVAVLLVLGVASFTSSAVGWWARRNVADTDMWLEHVGPLARDPAVQAAIGDWLSDQVIELVDPRELFAEVLPERGQLLAVPLSGAVEGFVRDRVDAFVASDRFERLWLAANERAHRAVLRVLRGESDVVDARGDRVVIDLVPAIDAVLADIGSASPDVLGRQVDLPEVSVDDVPEVAIRRLEKALGIPLQDDFGQFVVYDHGRLQALQDGLDRARRWLFILSATAVVALVAALWLSDRRRRTVLQMVVGLALGLALIRRLGLRGQRELLAAIPDTTNRDAARAVSDRFLDPLLAVTRNLLIVLAAVAVVALVSGPYPWAVRLRHEVAGLARRLGPGGRDVPAGGASDDLAGRVVAWMQANASAVRAAGLVAVVVVLLVADLSFLGLVVLAGLVALGAGVLRTGTGDGGLGGPVAAAGADGGAGTVTVAAVAHDPDADADSAAEDTVGGRRRQS
jgi:hypothetical protein